MTWAIGIAAQAMTVAETPGPAIPAYNTAPGGGSLADTPDPTTSPGPHAWAEEQLGITLRADGESLLSLQDLVGVAVRRNPRRTQLLVSRVLGRHYPTSPSALVAAGHLLAHLSGAALQGTRPAAEAGEVEDALQRVLRSPGGDRDRLHQAISELPPALDESADSPLVVAFAEAATGLGHAVSAALPGSTYIHSTHTDPPDFTGRRLEFQEPHSHSADHLILPGDHLPMDGDRPLVLVDDEVSTGTTIMNTIEALHQIRQRSRYVVATLVDLRSDDDRASTEAFARALGVDLSIVSLSSGSVDVPDRATSLGNEFVAVAPAPEPREWDFDPSLPRVFLWPSHVPAEAVHGVTAEQTTGMKDASRQLGGSIAGLLAAAPRRMLVLGVEEFQFVPSLVAYELESSHPETVVEFGAVTRSPVVALNRSGYPVRSAVAVTGTADSADRRFLYNVAGPHMYDAIVLVLPPTTDPDSALARQGVVRTLSGLTPELVAVQV